MKTRFLTLILVLAITPPFVFPQEAQGPMTRDQVMDLVKFGMSSADLVGRIKKLSIDFEPADDYLQGLRNAGAQDAVIQALKEARPKPLTRDQIGKLVAGGVPSERAAALVRQRGIDFPADDDYLKTLRLAGGDDSVISAVREASARVPAELVVETSPLAEVFLDGNSQGRASDQGFLSLKVKSGVHELKVTLAGKKDFRQSVTLLSGQASRISAGLVDEAGSIRLRTQLGASVTLDGIRVSMGVRGDLILSELAAGPHELRISAPGKTDYRQSVTVTAGQELTVEALLRNAPPAPGEARENPKDGLKYVWIPPGTFVMGCSPGDGQCSSSEQPPHTVTITRGFWEGQTEVTVGAYKRFAAATGRQMPPEPVLGARPLNPAWGNESLPVDNVQWDEAQAYCTWAGGRLLTDAEWEYAARAGNTSARYGEIDAIAWYADDSGRQHVDSVRLSTADPANYNVRLNENGNNLHEVGQKLPNAFGLFDTLGNVWEWTNDWYDEKYYQRSPSQDPPGPESGTQRVLRSASWYNGAAFMRASFHAAGGLVGRSVLVGFRCGGDVFAP